jgi:hypothetical protein
MEILNTPLVSYGFVALAVILVGLMIYFNATGEL